jgi:hypothetical protein
MKGLALSTLLSLVWTIATPIVAVEQMSKDGGTTCTDRLCLLLEGISGEVCYTRDQGP